MFWVCGPAMSMHHRAMHCKPRSIAALSALLLTGTSTPSLARAQAQDAPIAQASNAQEDATTIAAARALAIEGVKLVQAGRCSDAIDKLARAEKLHHAPIVLQNLGACEIEQGRLVEGTEELRKVLREPLPAKPSPALRRAYERAQQILDRTRPNIALLTIALELSDRAPAAEAAVTVAVDGQPVPLALLDAERPTDPGEHVIEASAAGYTSARTTLALAAGEKQHVSLSLERASNTVGAGAAADGAKSPGTPADLAVAPLAPANTARAAQAAGAAAHPTPSHAAAYVTWTAGAVALAIGTGFGGAALVRTHQLEAQCDGHVCSERVRGRLDTAKQFGTISTIGFGAGIAAGVLGAVLYWNAESSERESARATTRAGIGLGSAEVRVAF
jgi:hypothetical protein